MPRPCSSRPCDVTSRLKAASKRQTLALAGRALLQLDLAGLASPSGPTIELPGQADQVHGGEFRPGPLVAVVVEHLRPARLELGVDVLAGRVGRRVADS